MTEKLLLAEIKHNRAPSVQYLLFNKDSVLERHSFGLAGIGEQKEVNESTTYNVYSITKTFTALAILQLAQIKLLQLDSPVRQYLPDIPYNSKISIKHLLTHTSGIPNPIPLSWIHLADEDKNFNGDQFFNGIMSKYNKTKSASGEKFAYSNLGYILLGQIIEKVSGISYKEYIQNNIIKPLGIPETEMGFEIKDHLRHATGYHKDLSFSNLVLGFFIDKAKFMDTPVSGWKPFKPIYVNGAAYGGLVATADSLMKYVQALLDPDCPLIRDDFKKFLFTENHTTGNKATGMCYSWFKGKLEGTTFFTHAGGGGGYYCEIRIYPEKGLGSAVLFNKTGMSDERFLDRTDRSALARI